MLILGLRDGRIKLNKDVYIYVNWSSLSQHNNTTLTPSEGCDKELRDKRDKLIFSSMASIMDSNVKSSKYSIIIYLLYYENIEF